MAPLRFIMFLLFHGAWSVLVHRLLLTFPTPCSLTPWLVVHLFSASGRVLYLKQGTSWHPPEITAFPLEFFLSAASGSPDICLYLSISISITQLAITRQMVHMLSPVSVCSILVPLIFPISLLQLFPLRHPPHLAQALLPIAPAVRCHEDIHSVSLGCVSRRNRTVVCMQYSCWLVPQAGCWGTWLVNALIC